MRGIGEEQKEEEGAEEEEKGGGTSNWTEAYKYNLTGWSCISEEHASTDIPKKTLYD